MQTIYNLDCLNNYRIIARLPQQYNNHLRKSFIRLGRVATEFKKCSVESLNPVGTVLHESSIFKKGRPVGDVKRPWSSLSIRETATISQ